MPIRYPFRSSILVKLGATLMVVAFTGCGPDEKVTKYTAPKDPNDTSLISDEPTGDEPRVRILGAIAQAGSPNQWYFFKFQGPKSTDTYPPKAIERHKAEFDAFVNSLKFPKDGDPTWTVPSGWKTVDVRTLVQRITTFRMKKSETIVDLAISQVGGDFLENINRWRNQQAGVDPITEADVAKLYPPRTIDGRVVWIVDVSGPGPKAGAGMVPPFAK